MAMIVCPFCGSEVPCHSGGVVMRVCDTCEAGIRKGVTAAKEGRITPCGDAKDDVVRLLGPHDR